MSPRPASGFRFSPPRFELGAETTWALLRAFGPQDMPAPSVEAETAWGEAAALGLAPRIGSRVAAQQLAAELGEAAAQRFAAARRAAASTALRYEQLAADLAELAAGLGISLVFLKGVALQLAGATRPGERPLGDLDCLASGEVARMLWRALLERGFRAAEAPANEQHLPPLAAPVWGAVDLHFALRGVWHPGGDWWTAEQVLAEGLAHPVPELAGAFVPDRDLLAAHALAHGLDQHGLAPGRHGLLRLVGDLRALLPTDANWAAFLARASAWLAPTVSPEETGAARELTRGLAAGHVPVGRELDGAPGTLLRHLVATGEEAYDRSRRWRNRRLGLRRAQERRGLLRYIWRKLHRGGRASRSWPR